MHDVKYQARDLQKNSERGSRAFMAATMMLRDQAALNNSVSDLKGSLLRTHFENKTVAGLKSAFQIRQLQYDSKWLDKFSYHLTEMWCSLHLSLANPPRDSNKFDITLWLATMAYAKSADMGAVQALVGFYRLRDYRAIKLPTAAEFILPNGTVCGRSELQTIVQRAQKSYESSAEARMPKEGIETATQHLTRIRTLFQTRQAKEISDFLSAIQAQWPVREPIIPLSSQTYFDPSSVTSAIKDKFKTWWDNREFFQYLDQLSATMRGQVTIRTSTPCLTFEFPIKKFLLSDHVRQFGSRNIFSVSNKRKHRHWILKTFTFDN